MPWSQMSALKNLKNNGEVDNMDLPYLPWLCKMTSCVVYHWQAKKKRKENEKQLLNLSGRLYDGCFNGTLVYEVVVVDTSFNTFLFAGCIFASINFELARTITSCLVCFSSNHFNPLSFRHELYLIQFQRMAFTPVFLEVSLHSS